MTCYLGIDLGTSAVKALLVDDAQNVVASASQSLSLERPHPGWSEQNPDAWIRATTAAIDRLAADQPNAVSSVRSIGLSGQMHGATLLDKSDAPLRPCILWNDTRAHNEAAELDSDTQFRAITGNIVFPGFTAPKLVWVKRNEPEIFAAVERVLLPKDYLRLWLTGEYASDMSDSAGTSWFDTGARRWSQQLLNATDLDIAHMPRLVEGTEPAGGLRAELRNRWNMRDSVVVAGGGGDNAASACGIGVVNDNTAFVSLGTSGVLFCANNAYLPNVDSAVHTFCHAIPDTWHQMGVILSATDSLNWLAGIVGKSSTELAGALGDSLQSPSATMFLPYLGGERTPHNDAKVRGMFCGLAHETDSVQLTRAVVEGVAFALKDCLLALRDSGSSIDHVIAVGGGSNSRYWLQAVATALNVTVEVPSEGDFGAAFGAARLGMIACTGEDASSICNRPGIASIIEPSVQHRAAFDEAHQRFRGLYAGLNELAR